MNEGEDVAVAALCRGFVVGCLRSATDAGLTVRAIHAMSAGPLPSLTVLEIRCALHALVRTGYARPVGRRWLYTGKPVHNAREIATG